MALHGSRSLVLLLFLLAPLAGCLDSPDPATQPAYDEDTVSIEGPFAVLSFIDRGINPYHEVFRDDSPRAFVHPSTYLEEFPEDAIAVNITFDHETLADAVVADCEEWEKVEPGQVYWFPGTKVVGATTFIEVFYECNEDPETYGWPYFIFDGGHGTMVASRGAGNGYGACEECLIVAIEGFSTDAVTWSADQRWIDIQSNSWATFAPVFYPSVVDDAIPFPNIGSSSGFVAALEAAAERQPSFWASGNGVAYRGGVLGHPTQLSPHMGPNVIRVGAHDNGYASLWPGSSPHVISDGCWSWAAENFSMNESTPRTGGGTSAASPFAAGIAGKILLEARLILGDDRTGVRDGVLAQGPAGIMQSGPLADGVFTMQELREVLFKTADPRPEGIEEDGDACDLENTIDATQDDPLYASYLLYHAPPVAWKDVPEGPHGMPFVGYGATTPQSVELAFEVLRGEARLPERNVEDDYFDADEEYRRAMHNVYISVP